MITRLLMGWRATFRGFSGERLGALSVALQGKTPCAVRPAFLSSASARWARHTSIRTSCKHSLRPQDALLPPLQHSASTPLEAIQSPRASIFGGRARNTRKRAHGAFTRLS